MTNYNERLDEVLGSMKVEEYGTVSKADTKQALTSLIKELVEEAKPINEQGEIDIDVPAYNDGYYSGARNALERFEQNLLKELEEV